MNGFPDRAAAPLPDWILSASSRRTEPARQEQIEEGGRNSKLASLAGRLRRNGLAQDEIEAALLAFNESRCNPPLAEAEVRRIAESISRYDAHKAVSLVVRDASRLPAKQIPPVQELVDGVLTAGLMLLSGPPKIGKSWLVLDLILALGKGDRFWNRKISKPCKVLGLFLEDNERRLKSRIAKLTAYGRMDPDFAYAIHAPRIDEGLEEQLREQVREGGFDVVVVDTLATIRSPNPKFKNQVWQQDYESVRALKALADEFNVAVIVVTHNSKAAAGQTGGAQYAIAGTGGLVAGVDGLWVLEHTGHETEGGLPIVKLTIQHRDLEGGGYAVTFDKATAQWRMLGPFGAFTRGETQTSVLDALRATPGMKVSELADQIGKSRDAVAMALSRMRRDHLIVTTAGRNSLSPSSVNADREDRDDRDDRSDTSVSSVSGVSTRNTATGDNATNRDTVHLLINFDACTCEVIRRRRGG